MLLRLQLRGGNVVLLDSRRSSVMLGLKWHGLVLRLGGWNVWCLLR